MSEEKLEEVPAGKKKSAMLKIIAVVGVLVVVVAASIGGTLALTGFFSKKPADAGQLAEADSDAGGKQADDGNGADKEKGKGKDKGAGKGKGKDKDKDKDKTPQKRELPKDTQARFEKSYMDLDDKKALVANLAGSRKVMQVSLSLMTQYDDRVFKNVEKHRAALRSAALDVLRQVSDTDIAKPEFRAELAKQLRGRINAELERLENFGGIEEVFFTEFVYQ